MHCALDMAQHFADPFIWSGGMDRMGSLSGKAGLVEQVGIPRERPSHRKGGWVFLEYVQVEA